MTAGQPTIRGQGSAPTSRSWTTTVDGARLRQARHDHALPRAELAGTAGISVATLARLERQSTTRCRCRPLARLALALGEDPASTTLRPAV